MALIAELQDVIMEETIQHRMALEEGTKRLVSRQCNVRFSFDSLHVDIIVLYITHSFLLLSLSLD